MRRNRTSVITVSIENSLLEKVKSERGRVTQSIHNRYTARIFEKGGVKMSVDRGAVVLERTIKYNIVWDANNNFDCDMWGKT